MVQLLRNLLGPRRLALLLVVLCLIAWAPSALACPTCKDNLAADPASANLARGYYYSILFMVSMPYLIFSCMGFYFYSLVRKARRERESLELARQQSSANAAISAPPVVTADVNDDELVGV